MRRGAFVCFLKALAALSASGLAASAQEIHYSPETQLDAIDAALIDAAKPFPVAPPARTRSVS